MSDAATLQALLAQAQANGPQPNAPTGGGNNPPAGPAPDVQGQPAGNAIPPQIAQQMSQAQQQQQGLQAPNLRDQMMPNVARLITQLIKPTAQVQPGQTADQLRPPSRLDAFENFLGTFMEAFAQGMSHSGSGPGANAKGFGAAVLAPQNQDIQQFGLNQQAAQAQQGQQQAQAQLAETQARTAGIPAAIQERLQQSEVAAGARESAAQTTAGGRVQVQGMKNAGAMQLQGLKNTGAVTIEQLKAASAQSIAKMVTQGKMQIAAAKDATSRDVAAMRVAAGNDPNKLTPQMKSMKEQATALLPQINRIDPMIDKVASKLGPGAGRWSDFWQGKVGGNDPQFSELKDEMGFLETGVALAHARGRMSNIVFEHFQKMFEAGKQDPANMHAAMKVARQWMTDYSKLGEGAGGAAAGGAAAKTPAAGGSKVIMYNSDGTRQ